MSIYAEDYESRDRALHEALAWCEAELESIRIDALLDGVADGWRYDDGIQDCRLV